MAAVRQLGQFHADLCAVELRKHFVSCSSFTASESTKRDCRGIEYAVAGHDASRGCFFRHPFTVIAA